MAVNVVARAHVRTISSRNKVRVFNIGAFGVAHLDRCKSAGQPLG